MAKILDGRIVKEKREAELARSFAELSVPTALSIIQVGENKESAAYIEQKIKFGDKLGVETKLVSLPEDISMEDAKAAIKLANDNSDVSGIILQLPLFAHLNQYELLDEIDPRKDVDGLTAINLGKLVRGVRDAMVPATARGVLSLLSFYDIPVVGKNVLIIGRSVLVGKPLALALTAKDATVTIAHSKTEDLQALCRASDIIISATGSPGLITKDFVSEGQTVVDVGISVASGEKEKKKLFGDVVFDDVEKLVSAISPVPGGVGPMTVLSIFENLLDLAKKG